MADRDTHVGHEPGMAVTQWKRRRHRTTHHRL